MKIKNTSKLATCFGLNNKPSSGQLMYVYGRNKQHKVSYQSSDGGGNSSRSSGGSSSKQCQSIKNCKHVMFTHKLPLFCITLKRLLKDSVPSNQLFCNHNSLSTMAILRNVKKA